MPLLRTAVLAFAALIASPSLAEELKWNAWDADLFARAKAENRLVILDLEAVWCHWCHVMRRTTYRDPKVVELMKDKFLPVRVDQDANPDLSNRYGDWGWPATILFAADGTELAKMRGYIPPERMAALLDAFIKDPRPGPSATAALEVVPSETAFLTKERREALIEKLDQSYDAPNGGWGAMHKYIDADSMDFTLAAAEKGDKEAIAKARQTFDAALALIDPVWGGVYQYSDEVDWKSPHYEKIMSFQANYMRQYSQAYALWKEPTYLAAARDIARYLSTFMLSPEGALYTSQDADLNQDVHGDAFYALSDAERRKLGVPRIDKNIYARENGWAISGLVALYNVTNEPPILDMAERAMAWVMANRAIDGGGFRHGDSDRGGPFLGDTLAVGQAALDLYGATGKRQWLEAAAKAGDFMAKTFHDEAGGFLTSATSEAKVGVFVKPAKIAEEQVQVARFANMLNRYHGDKAYRDLAGHAMRYLTASALLDLPRPLPGVLVADQEFALEPTHITIVGRKDDLKARVLHAAARAFPSPYKRLDWWDTREGPLPNPDVEYPELDEAAAFACTAQICSWPALTAEELKTTDAQEAADAAIAELKLRSSETDGPRNFAKKLETRHNAPA